MPTLVPVRPAVAAERVNAPAVIASLLAVAVLTTMTILTPTKYPAMSGMSASTTIAHHS